MSSSLIFTKCDSVTSAEIPFFLLVFQTVNLTLKPLLWCFIMKRDSVYVEKLFCGTVSCLKRTSFETNQANTTTVSTHPRKNIDKVYLIFVPSFALYHVLYWYELLRLKENGLFFFAQAWKSTAASKSISIFSYWLKLLMTELIMWKNQSEWFQVFTIDISVILTVLALPLMTHLGLQNWNCRVSDWAKIVRSLFFLCRNSFYKCLYLVSMVSPAEVNQPSLLRTVWLWSSLDEPFPLQVNPWERA